MKNILFIAPPAGGKGTQSDLLVENFGYVHISTGDLLRDVDVTTDLGKKIREIQGQGGLVDDDTVFALLEEKFRTLNGQHFLLDGCVRTIKQADMMEDLLSKLGLNLDAVIYLDVPYDILVKRATGRISCPSCKSTFNKYFKQPKSEGICDKCGKTLITRNDDDEETFKVRYETYLYNTEPLLDYYRSKEKLIVVDGVNNVSETIASVIKNG